MPEAEVDTDDDAGLWAERYVAPTPTRPGCALRRRVGRVDNDVFGDELAHRRRDRGGRDAEYPCELGTGHASPPERARAQAIAVGWLSRPPSRHAVHNVNSTESEIRCCQIFDVEAFQRVVAPSSLTAFHSAVIFTTASYPKREGDSPGARVADRVASPTTGLAVPQRSGVAEN